MSWVSVGLAAMQAGEGMQNAQLIQGNAALSQQLAGMNAKYANVDAFNASKMGYTESARYADIEDATEGAQRSGFAEDNVNVGFGTAADVQANTKITGMLNTIDIQNQAFAKSQGFEKQGRNDILQGVMGGLQSSTQAQGAQTQGVFNAVKTGISGYNTAYPRNNPQSTQVADASADVTGEGT